MTASGGDPAAERADLVADEGRPVAGRPELGALVDGRPGLPEGLEQRLVALAAGVDQHQRELGIGVLGVASERVDERAGRLVHAGDDDQPVPTEQRGREHVGQLPDRQAEGGQLVLLGVGVVGRAPRPGRRTTARARSSSSSPTTTRSRDGGFDGVGRHARIVSRGSDTRRPARAHRRRRRPRPPHVADPRAATPQRAAADDGEVALPVGAVHPHAGAGQPVEQPAGGVPVGVVGADRDQRDPGTAGGQELRIGVRRCRGAAP